MVLSDRIKESLTKELNPSLIKLSLKINVGLIKLSWPWNMKKNCNVGLAEVGLSSWNRLLLWFRKVYVGLFVIYQGEMWW